jgi:hypothetical protein
MENNVLVETKVRKIRKRRWWYQGNRSNVIANMEGF